MLSFDSNTDINSIWDKVSKEFIYMFIADMFGYSQDVTKEKMRTSLEDAELKSREEKQAEEEYKKYSEEAYKAWKTKHGRCMGLTRQGILYCIFGGTLAVALSATMGLVVGAGVLSAGAAVPAAVALGVAVLIACLVASAVIAFALQGAAAIFNGGIDNINTMWTGGRNNIDENGNTKDDLSWLAWCKLDDSSKLKDKAAHEYNQALATKEQIELQDAQREIQNIMNTKYSEEQNNQSTAMDNFNKVLKDITNLTIVR